MSQPLYAVYGASGCGRGIMPLARTQLGSPERLVFIDDGLAGTQCNGHAVLSLADFLAMPASSRHAVVAIADSRVRERLTAMLGQAGVQPWTVQAQQSVIMDAVEVGPGAAISPYVVLTSNILIGCAFHANLYSYVEHDCRIGDFVTFAPGVHCNGNVVIEDHVYVGAGAMIRQGRPGRPLVIGRGACIGMGAVVLNDVAPSEVVIGNPARLLRKDNRSC